MVGDILKIKTNIPPMGTNILALPRILEYLDEDLMIAEGFARQLTMLSAPAGFGKTALVRKWLSGREDDTAWYSLDEGDNEPERFWLYLITALQKIKNGLSNGLMEVLRSQTIFTDSSSSGEALLVPLLNDLFVLEKPHFLILDDYHHINNPRIHADMVFFIENLPPTLHLAVTTRSDPPWPLYRWRVKSKMAEIRLKDLKLSEEEAGQLLTNFKGIHLSEAQLQTLYLKTEGWVTGLQLAAFSLATSSNVEDFIDSFAGSHRQVHHFLSEEVLAGQPETVREFLLQTSILERFNAPLCDAVTERTDSNAVLASLERDNLFVIPLDEEGTWYRYHQLFADLLLYQLKRYYPEKVDMLHERAGRWFLEAGEPGEAVRHAFADNNIELALQIIHDHHEEILTGEGTSLLYNNMKLFTPELLKKFPRLAAHMALIILILKGREAAGPCIEMAEGLGYENKTEQNEYLGILAGLKAYYDVNSHRFSHALKNAEKALQLLPRHSYYWRMNVAIYCGDANLFSGNPRGAYPFYLEAHHDIQKVSNQFLSMTAGFKVATSLCYMGKLKEAEAMTLELLRKAKSEGLARIPRVGLLWTLLGELLREKGELEEAGHCIERGLIFSEPEKICLGWNYLFKIALTFSQGEYHKALQTVKQLENLNYEAKLPLFITFPAAAWEGRILLELGERDRAREVLLKAGIEKDRVVAGGLEKGYLVLTQILLTGEDGDHGTSRRLLEQVEAMATRGEHKKLLIETKLRQVCLEEKRGFFVAAESCLISALEAGLEAGYFQTYLDESKGLASVFKRVFNRVEMNDSARKLYARILPEEEMHWKQQTPMEKVKQPPASSNQELVEELSERELEVLNLISEGLSNNDIAGRLFISQGTVKWHTTNIYGKLGVRKRTEAVAMARKLSLIA